MFCNVNRSAKRAIKKLNVPSHLAVVNYLKDYGAVVRAVVEQPTSSQRPCAQ